MNSKLYISLKYVVCIAAIVTMVTSCSVKKYIPEDEWLYTGSTLEVKSKAKNKGKAKLRYELEDVVEPKPNSTIFGIRFGLYWYYKSQKEGAGKTSQFLNKKYGEEPVYLSDVDIDRNKSIINNRCENRGYFYSKVNSEILKKKKKASASYRVDISKPYTLATYTYKGDSLLFDSLVIYSMEKTLLKPGTTLSTSLLKKERNRIDFFLKDQGYYYFNPEVLIFTSDTNQYDDRRFDLQLSFKSQVKAEAIRPYKIRNIETQILPSASAEDSLQETVEVINGMPIYQTEFIFKPKFLRPYISIGPGEMYSKTKGNNSTKRILATRSFQMVNLKYHRLDSIGPDSIGYLDAKFVLAPAKKQAVQLEFQTTAKSNSFAGPGLIGSYFNKNLFNGGERLEISGNISYETQIGGGSSSNLTALEIKMLNSITFPRFLVPFNYNPVFDKTIPNTKVSFDFILQRRAQYYTLNSYIVSFGYNWKSSTRVYQEIAPISLNYTNVQHITDEFQEILDDNPFLARSFESQFIPGLTYLFSYSEAALKDKQNRFHFSLGADIAGNLIGAIQDLNNKEHTLLDLPYAQYLRGDIDVRHYRNIWRESVVVSRLFVGVGYPYNLTTSLPFAKQYYSGGPNSIRGFWVRSIGPGAYQQPETNSDFEYFDRTGDIRLEANVEFRHPLASLLKGAAFIDAGNIWLYNENPAIPGGQFSSQWYQEIAMSVGYGFRLDIDFIVVRLDLGTPLRYPFKVEGSYWQQEFKPFNTPWRKDNLIFNFAIGYPF